MSQSVGQSVSQSDSVLVYVSISVGLEIQPVVIWEIWPLDHVKALHVWCGHKDDSGVQPSLQSNAL